ncbi:MAG: protein kinase, partial [Planctomycetes bacterium]|nr:protein kinase [Planctomycetota bacterium]
MMDQNALRRVIRALWLADLQSGQGRSLEGYQDLFPGLEELVRNEIEGLKLQEPGEKHSVSSPVTPMSTAGARPQADLSGRLGPYRFLRELGRGGQAIVYLAEDERLHRRVALKVLTRFGSDSTSTIERFRREAEVTSRLEHPGICPVFDAGMVDGVPFIAMKHIEGLSLADRLAVSRPARSEPEDAFFDDSDADLSTDAEVASAAPAGETPIALPEALLLVEKVARALHAAHEAEIIHRDI